VRYSYTCLLQHLLRFGFSPRRKVRGLFFYPVSLPVQTLFDYLEAGDTIDDFLEGFPSVTREHVIAFLEEAKNRLIESAT